MHILPSILTLLLAFGPGSATAGEISLESLRGAWTGKVKSTDDCVWTVDSAVRGKNGTVSGTFSYKGKCAPKKRTGTFVARPSKKRGRFTATAAVPGMPKIRMTGSFDKTGLVKFSCLAFKGTLRLSKDLASAKLAVDAGMGGASGTLKSVPGDTGDAGGETAVDTGGETGNADEPKPRAAVRRAPKQEQEHGEVMVTSPEDDETNDSKSPKVP